MSRKGIAIFASGSGSNAQKIMEHFKEHPLAEVRLVLSNRPEAFVLERADNFEIPTHVFSFKEFYENFTVLDTLNRLHIDIIILAGFLWKVPDYILQAFPNRILNIHPALLPKYGGKGMYGLKVHEAVLKNRENETGITIHLVNQEYDAGEILAQYHCKVEPEDDPEKLQFRVQQLEYLHFPQVIEEFIKNLPAPDGDRHEY